MKRFEGRNTNLKFETNILAKQFIFRAFSYSSSLNICHFYLSTKYSIHQFTKSKTPVTLVNYTSKHQFSNPKTHQKIFTIFSKKKYYQCQSRSFKIFLTDFEVSIKQPYFGKCKLKKRFKRFVYQILS